MESSGDIAATDNKGLEKHIVTVEDTELEWWHGSLSASALNATPRCRDQLSASPKRRASEDD
jgi:hypothetical protein